MDQVCGVGAVTSEQRVNDYAWDERQQQYRKQHRHQQHHNQQQHRGQPNIFQRYFKGV